jgi:hypothetical protein
MKTFRLAVMGVAVAGLTMAATVALAQDASPAPQLFNNAAEVLHLVKANVGDDTVVAYIKNSGRGYPLNADQIIYLHQQGVSSTVLNTMLAQPTGLVSDTASTSTPATTVAATTAPVPTGQTILESPATTVVEPAVTYVQTPNTYYYYSDASPYYYPIYVGYNYGWCSPVVRFSTGWGGGWHGGWHGAVGAGFHGGAGFRGGSGFHSVGGFRGGGGFHGGGHR